MIYGPAKSPLVSGDHRMAGVSRPPADRPAFKTLKTRFKPIMKLSSILLCANTRKARARINMRFKCLIFKRFVKHGKNKSPISGVNSTFTFIK
jgi:hypothetical protein